MHVGKGRDDVLEWVKRKRLKQVLKNQRRHREEIFERKQLEKQKSVIAALVVSASLQDEDYHADQARVAEALREYDIKSRSNESAAFAELERRLWIPPRVRDPEGLADSLVPLAFDFVDTPEVRAERRRLREQFGAVPGVCVCVGGWVGGCGCSHLMSGAAGRTCVCVVGILVHGGKKVEERTDYCEPDACR